MVKARLCYLVCFFVLMAGYAHGQTINVAVASNFKPTFERLARLYLKKFPEDNITISSASSGILYSQIVNGAPFDLFLSADKLRPKWLENKNKTLPGSRLTYATGRLVLWSYKPINSAQSNFPNIDGKVAIANPLFAPFGLAAKEAMKNMQVWQEVQDRLVKGNSVLQVGTMVSLGAVSAGFVSSSQVMSQPASHIWHVPTDLYPLVDQQMVVLTKHSKTMEVNPKAKILHRFMLSDSAKRVILSAGYNVPSS